MNIHQLLSVSQSSPQPQSPGAFNRQDPVNGLFHQALLQASDTSRLSASRFSEISASQAPQEQTTLNALSSLASAGLEVDIENLSAALETLRLDINESDFSELLAQLQLPNSDISTGTLGLNDGQASTPLNEIAGRLALMASFTESSPVAQLESPVAPATVEAIAKQLNIGQTEAAQLADIPALKTLLQSLSMDKSRPVQSIAPAALEIIADQLDINQTEAAQLVSALNVLVGQQNSAPSRPVETAQLTNIRSPVTDMQRDPRAQPDTFFSQINTGSSAQQINSHTAAPQISSEALMAALLTTDGASKTSPSSEHSLTGMLLNSGSSPLATSQSTQGFSPTVTPTPTTLATPLTSPAWPQQLSQQLVQISQRGGEQHVQMQLNPAELGPLSISLKFGEQGAQAHFLSAHAQVRQVLEQAIPQLREALAEQGISLGETSVGEQRDPNDQAFAQSSGKHGATAGSDNGEMGSDEAPIQNAGSGSLTLDGRVDLYA